MAFHQSQRQPAPRSAPVTTFAPVQQPYTQDEYDLPIQRSREWVIFSPDSMNATEAQTLSTAHTHSAHHFDAGRLQNSANDGQSDVDGNQDNEEQDGETEDLDSLDDGLHAFQEPAITPRVATPVFDHGGDTLLPSHDGLGMFHPSSSDVQEQLWQHERYNPRRVHHALRRSSLQRVTEALDEAHAQEHGDDKFRRIEQWRVDQSRAILEEVERETRRNRKKEKLIASSAGPKSYNGGITNPETHDKMEASSQTPVFDTSTADTFWTRFTRTVIRDFIGLDDTTLSLIFGEELVGVESRHNSSAKEITKEAEPHASTDRQIATLGDSWQARLVARVTKELGVLVHTLDDDSGAFATYPVTADTPLYPGLIKGEPKFGLVASPDRSRKHDAASEMQFTPTLAHQGRPRQVHTNADASLWGINEADGSGHEPILDERNHWEQVINAKDVFKYLRSRFLSTNTMLQTPKLTSTARVGRTDSDSLRRAALIRRHHPLMSQRPDISGLGTAPVAQHSPRGRTSVRAPAPVLGRRQNGREESVASCASQSTKRSRTARSDSSKNYWDVGSGSLGSGGWNVDWGQA